LLAVVLVVLADVLVVADLMIRNPELLLAQIGGIVVISRLMAWRLWQGFNPKARTSGKNAKESNKRIREQEKLAANA
jgi:hypothetical protein